MEIGSKVKGTGDLGLVVIGKVIRIMQPVAELPEVQDPNTYYSLGDLAVQIVVQAEEVWIDGKQYALDDPEIADAQDDPYWFYEDEIEVIS